MTNDRPQRLLDLVDGALAEEPARRQAWLAEACGDDTELLAEANSLLAFDEDADVLLHVSEAATDVRLGTLKIGSQLGDYLLEKQIGAGGMGVVYQAKQVSLNRRVALKVLPAHLRYSASAQARFRQEIEAAARLHHTNIVAVHTAGELLNTQFFAMELIDGPPLSAVIEQLRINPVRELQSASLTSQRKTSESVETPELESLLANPFYDRLSNNYFDTIATLVADVADGLAYAHNSRVIHRDIKPSNLLISQDGQLHISDFGLARMEEQPGLTQTGECLGTPYYMAPEQISADTNKIDGRTDIYALGATLYEILTLQPPFPGESRDQVIAQIVRDEPTPPRSHNKRVPRDLETICLKAIEKEPSRRYQTADQMAADLRAYVNRFAISAKRIGPVARTIKWSRRHRGLSFALATSTVLAAMAIFFAFRAHDSQTRWNATRQEQVFETALLAALEGKQENAKSSLEEAKRLGAPPERLHLLQGQVDLIAVRQLSAHQHFQQATELLPESVAAHSLLALSWMQRHSYSNGEAVFRHVQELTPVTLDDFLQKARIESYFDAAEAVKTLDETIDRNKTSVAARLIRAKIQTSRTIDTADPTIAESALADFSFASEMLGDNPLVASGQMKALLAAATTFDLQGLGERRDQLLRRADEIAVVLSKFDGFRAHRARAFYFDYIGDVDQALAEWQTLHHQEILFPVLTLYREGRLDEALEICQQYRRVIRDERIVDFFEALIMAAKSDSPEAVRNVFPMHSKGQLTPIHELLAVYTISCLTGNLQVAQSEAIRLHKTQRLPALRNGWYRHLSAFVVGELSAKEFLQETMGSRKRQCEAHYYVGISELGSGNREAAREHFRRSAESRVFGYFEYFLSRALLAQLQRDPEWPPWLPLKSAPVSNLKIQGQDKSSTTLE